MTQHINAQGQPVGDSVPDWQGCPAIPHGPMYGRTCNVVPLREEHGADLHGAFSIDTSGALWTYMSVGPFNTEADYAHWVAWACKSKDPLFFAIVDRSTGRAIGVASYLRIRPDNGVVEVGYITFSPQLQRTVMATEAMYLMMKRTLGELGYRRYEWKCDALNAPSRKAATRLGFQYDGLFKQAQVYKGRNRDTAWFSILDQDWSQLQVGFEAWLDPANFDADGLQKTPLQISLSGRNDPS